MIPVVAGILRREDGYVLIAERREAGDLDGFWEFPGGKVEADETDDDALARELAEELGVAVQRSERLTRLEHRYPDRQVSITFFLVTRWSGLPSGRQGQAIRWIDTGDLGSVRMLPADQPVIDMLGRSTDA